MPNLKAKINAHNKSLLNKVASDSGQKECNCQRSRECPLQGNCVVKDVVYKAVIRTPNQEEGEGHTYLGLASGFGQPDYFKPLQELQQPSIEVWM